MAVRNADGGEPPLGHRASLANVDMGWFAPFVHPERKPESISGVYDRAHADDDTGRSP